MISCLKVIAVSANHGLGLNQLKQRLRIPLKLKLVRKRPLHDSKEYDMWRRIIKLRVMIFRIEFIWVSRICFI
ncbi:hypothetical protein SUGI_0531400 [Cryptomeria japonica]|nr:hypothetical protein SUGI_0531400 [Cryptomeria japonica]